MEMSNFILPVFYNISLSHYLILGLIMFCIGLFGLLISRNILRMLMCIELMFVSCNINLIAFTHYNDLGNSLGESFSIFVMAISAIEVAIGIAILIYIFKSGKDVNVDSHKELGGRNV